MQRLAVLTTALGQSPPDPDLIYEAMKDRVHQPYRKLLVSLFVSMSPVSSNHIHCRFRDYQQSLRTLLLLHIQGCWAFASLVLGRLFWHLPPEDLRQLLMTPEKYLKRKA